MKKTSTQSTVTINTKHEGSKNFAPSKSTIDFIKQFTFEDLIGDMGRHYAFDFAVFENNKLSMEFRVVRN